MRRGCCFGCLGLVLIVAGAFFYAGYTLGSYDIVTLSPRGDTLAAAQETPHAWLRIDPNAAELQEILRYGLEDATGLFTPILNAVLPYEASVVFSAEPEMEVSRLVFAMSLRRLGGVLEARASPQLWQWFAPQRVDSLGLEGPGLWVVRSHLPLSAETLASHEAHYAPGQSDGVPPEGVHVLEGGFDNRHGQAYLALSTLLHPPQLPGDMAPDRPVDMAHGTLAQFFAMAETVWFAANFLDAESVKLDIVVTCVDETAAANLLFLGQRLEDSLHGAMADAGARVSGGIEVAGRELRGEYVIGNARDPLVRRLRREGVL